MPRVPLTLTDEMDRAVRKIAEQRGAPIASVIRGFIRDGLEREGFEIRDRVVWGRSGQDDQTGRDAKTGQQDQSGESAAVA